MASNGPSKVSRDFPRDLFENEIFWRDLQPWLETKGYMLRPRYKPDWKPSWKKGDNEWKFEDSNVNVQRAVMDATRISDGEMVMLKKVLPSVHPHEADITRYFSTEPVKSHPQNRCVPLLDMFEVPDLTGADRTIIMGEAKHYTRTAHPTKYYIIDFGLSRQYDPRNGPPLELPIPGGDKSVQEFKADYNNLYNPQPVPH
ncbi:hypothetical protein C8Q75DRAFT_808160 [Abortiporus biennis]|nr:hypothetical protein C8Q75DRAFT_808160 [Abortiporus biennis]